MAELPNTATQLVGSDQEEYFESSCHDSLKTSSSSSSTCSLEEEDIPGATAPASSKSSELFGEDEVSESCTLRLEVAEDDDLLQDEGTDWWPTPPSLSDVEESVTANSNGGLLGRACDRAIENVDVLFQRIVRERSTELNELQNAARPVTGTNARDNLSEFFNRALDPSPRPNPNQSLPEDVQRLVQRSIVTSALRRQGFRSVLEQSLAAQLVTTTQRNPLPLARVPIRRRSPSGTSTPSVSVQESDAASVISDATTEQFNDNVSEAESEIEQLQRAIDVGVQALSETIQEDLTQLHHLHVVSSALGGDFRDNLERLVQQRASTVGGGELVERFIRSLSSAPRPQPSTPTAPRRNSSLPVARGRHLNLPSEIASLKQQVEEMKRVMQMSLEMQMDTQRAIRQEVSAVFGAFMQQMAQASASGLPAHQTTAPSSNPTTVTAGSCVICLDQQVDTVLYQCGHMCVCNGCGLRLKMQGHKCPMCRAPIRDVIRAYKSQ